MGISKTDFNRLLDNILKQGVASGEIDIITDTTNKTWGTIYFKNIQYIVELNRIRPIIRVYTAYGESYTYRMRIN